MALVVDRLVAARSPWAHGAALARWARAALFALLAAYILIGPFLVQILGVRHVLLRPWTMYSGVGVGILKGSFVLERPGGARHELSPLEILGLEHYPNVPVYRFAHRVRQDDDLPLVAAGFCAGLGARERLSFDGWVGTRQGWRRLEARDLCREAEP